jgi:hypothetical protein
VENIDGDMKGLNIEDKNETHEGETSM